jgi:hypothetical protein
MNQRTMLRFLELIACDNGKTAAYAKLVDDPNDAAHPNGNTFYSAQAALAVKITEVLRVVDEIQSHSKPVIEHCYREFLLQNHDPDESEYPTICQNAVSGSPRVASTGFDQQALQTRPYFAQAPDHCADCPFG